jgi:hypothetical protein
MTGLLMAPGEGRMEKESNSPNNRRFLVKAPFILSKYIRKAGKNAN